MIWTCSHPCFHHPCCSRRDSKQILDYTVRPSGHLETTPVLCCSPASRLCLQTLSQLAHSHQYLNVLKLLSFLKARAKKTLLRCCLLHLLFDFMTPPHSQTYWKVCSSCLYFLTSGLLASPVLSGVCLSYSGLLVTSLLLNPADASQPLSYLTSWLHLILSSTSLLETWHLALCFGVCTLEPVCLGLSPRSATYSLCTSKLFHLCEPQFPPLKKGITEHLHHRVAMKILGSFLKHITLRIVWYI